MSEVAAPPVAAPAAPATPPPASVTPPAAPVTPAAAEPAAAAPKATKVNELYDWLTTGPTAKPVKKKEPEAKKPDEPTTPDPAKTSEEPKPEVKAPKTKTKTRHVVTGDQPPVNTDDLSKKIADGVTAGVKAVVDSSRTKTEEKPAAPKLPEMFLNNAPVYEALEKIYPEKYGNGKLIKELAGSAKRIEAYRNRWEADNPDKPFNEMEHRDEIDAMLPDVDQDHVVEARVHLGTEKVRQEFETKLKRQDSQIEQTRVASTVLPEAKAAVASLGAHIIEHVSPELHKLFLAGDRAGSTKFNESHPDVLRIVEAVKDAQAPLIERAYALMSPGGSTLINREKPTENDILLCNQVIPSIEAELDGVQDAKGKTFVPYAKMMKIPEAERSNYRVINREIVTQVMTQTAIELARQQLSTITDHEAAILKKYGYEPNGKPAKVEAGKATETNGSSASGVQAAGAAPTVKPVSGRADTRKSSFDKVWNGIAGIR